MAKAKPREPGGKSAAGEIQAVSRAAELLGLFGPETLELTAAEAAERLGMNRSTAYRYCTSLVATGLLDRAVDAGKFIPGKMLLQLGAFAIGRRKVMQLAPAGMQALSLSTHATAVLSLWGAAGPVVSRVEESPDSLALVTVRVGGHLPLDAAQAMIFLAFHADQLGMERLLANMAPQRRAALLERVEHVRRTGHCSTASTPGVVAIAVPVFDEYGMCASLAVVGTDNALSQSDDAPELAMVIDTARDLTKEMGGNFVIDDL